MTENATSAPETAEAVEGTAEILNLSKDITLGAAEFKTIIEEHKGLGKFVEEDKINVTKALKSLANAEKLIGKRIEEASPEQLQSFYAKLGVPQDASEYELDAPENLQEYAGEFKKLAKEAGVSKGAAEKLFKSLQEVNSSENKLKVEKEKIEVQTAKLAEMFGDKLGEIKKQANKALESFGSDSLKDEIVKQGLGTNPEFIKFLSTIGAKLTDKDVVSEKPASYVPDKTEIQNKIQAIRSSEEYKKALSKPYGAEYKAITEQMTALYQQL